MSPKFQSRAKQILSVVLLGCLTLGAVRLARSPSTLGGKNHQNQRVPVVPSIPKRSSVDLTELQKHLMGVSTVDELRNCLAEFAPGEQICTLGTGTLLRESATAWFERDPKQALDLIAALPDEDSRLSAILWGGPWYSREPEAFLTTISKSLNPVNSALLFRSVFKSLGETNPTKGLELIDKQGQGENKNRAIGSLFVSMAYKNPQMAISKVEELAFPEDRKLALQAIDDGLQLRIGRLKSEGKKQEAEKIEQLIHRGS